MQSNSRYFTGYGYTHDGHDPLLGGHGAYSNPIAPPLPDALQGRNHELPRQLAGIEFQPTEICPKNFIIFDQTEKKSRVMYHPTWAHNFGSPGFDVHATQVQDGFHGFTSYNDDHDDSSTPLQEDTEDIDALLSSGDEEGNDDDEEEEEEEDDDVVSTGRTPGSLARNSSISSCSTERCKYRNSSAAKSYSSTAGSSERKKARMRKMVRALRGIIPGSDQMDTSAVIDEAVKYLKSLKVEVKKLGVENLED